MKLLNLAAYTLVVILITYSLVPSTTVTKEVQVECNEVKLQAQINQLNTKLTEYSDLAKLKKDLARYWAE